MKIEKEPRSARARSALALATVLAPMVASCGGGGSSSSGGTPAPVATAPTITSSASASVVENTTGTAYTASASDPQNDPIIWDVFAGADAGSFTIDSNGALAFQEAPNFDLPGDANGDNIYEVTIRARAGGEQDTLALRLEVTNDKEGISVTRVVTGLVDPVSFAPIPN